MAINIIRAWSAKYLIRVSGSPQDLAPLSEKFFSELRIGQDLKNGEVDSRIKISSVSILFSANFN